MFEQFKMLLILLPIMMLLVNISHQDGHGDDVSIEILLKRIFNGSEEENPDTSGLKSCVTKKGEKGSCVPFYLCNDGVINTDGTNVIDVRVLSDDEGPCTNLQMCCLQPQTGRIYGDPIKVGHQRLGCGWRNPRGLGHHKRNHDNEAEYAEFPWMVAVLKKEPINQFRTVESYLGGGSLIHPSVVLTAAHIVSSIDQVLKVRAGEWDTQTEDEVDPCQERLVGEVVKHENFNAKNLFFDIALLFLNEPFTLAPNVALACLPVENSPTPVNTRCFATGWGKDKFGSTGFMQNILKKIDLPVVDHSSCEATLRTTRLSRHFNLHGSFLCAGGEPGRDMCTGDGGSPLVCPVQSSPDRYQVSGLVLWGLSCGRGGVPGVYADVGQFRDWVDRHVAARGHDTLLYRY